MISLGTIWQLFMTGKALTKPWKALGLYRCSDFHYDIFKPAIYVYLVLHFCNLYSIPYLVVTWTVNDRAYKYICLKSGLCWYLYASIGLFKTMKFVFKKRKNQNAIFFPVVVIIFILLSFLNGLSYVIGVGGIWKKIRCSFRISPILIRLMQFWSSYLQLSSPTNSFPR